MRETTREEIRAIMREELDAYHARQLGALAVVNGGSPDNRSPYVSRPSSPSDGLAASGDTTESRRAEARAPRPSVKSTGDASTSPSPVLNSTQGAAS